MSVSTDKINLLGMSQDMLEQFFAARDEKPFRARQILQWIYQRGVIDFDEMTDLSKKLRDRLKEDAIPLGARILTVADAYDALTSRRPYRDALGVEEAHRILEEAAGTQFDPVIMRAFLDLKRGIAPSRLEKALDLESENVQDAKAGKSGLSGVIGTAPLDLS